MNYSGIINCTIVDGNGFRVALYISGCNHKCEGCHNKETWDFNFGKEYTHKVEEILFDRIDKPFIKGLTLTGGDPLYHSAEVLELLKRFRERFGETKDVWLYTGFTMEEISLSDDLKSNVIELCDYVVDGRFEISKRDTSLPFRGSKNQIIWKKGENGMFEHSSLN